MKKYKDQHEWMDAVKKAYPEKASKIKFKGRVEGEKNTISAEVSGEDRSYGVFDMDKEEGIVLGESYILKLKKMAGIKESSEMLVPSISVENEETAGKVAVALAKSGLTVDLEFALDVFYFNFKSKDELKKAKKQVSTLI